MPDPMQRRSARAYFWAIVESSSRQCLGMVFFLLLARLLPAYTLGLLAAAAVSLEFAKCFFDEPVGEVLVQRHRIARADVDSLFWCLFIVGVVILGAIDSGAGLLATLYGAADIVPITWALSVAALLGSLGTVPQALLRRRMHFRALANRQILAHVLSGSVAVGAALLGCDVWSLVAGQIVAAAACTALIWPAVRWRPRMAMSFSAIRSMLPYIHAVVLIRLIQTGRNQLDKLLIGALFGIEVLGYYAVAVRVVGVLTDGVLGAFNQVNLASLSKTQQARSLFNERFYLVQTVTALSLAPAYTALLTNGDEVVRVLLGAAWAQTGLLLPWLAISGCCAIIIDTHSVGLRSVNRPAWALAMSCASLLADIAIMISVGRTSILTVVSLIALKNIAASVLVMVLGRVTLGTRLTAYAAPLIPVALACAAMAATSVVVHQALADHGPTTRAVASLAAGGLVYVGVSAVAFRNKLAALAASRVASTDL
jgi:O-antigen/teichoic acid export membrane protein